MMKEMESKKNVSPIIDEVGIGVIKDGVKLICELINEVDVELITSENKDVLNAVLDGVDESGELVCKLDDEGIILELDNDIIDGDDDGTVLDWIVLDGVDESGELVCKLDDEDTMSELDDGIIDGDDDWTVLDGVDESGELVCKLDDEDIMSELDDDIIEGDDNWTVLNGVDESGELVCKLDDEDIMLELDNDIIGDEEDRSVLDTTDVVVVLSITHSLGQFGSLLGIYPGKQSHL